MIHIYSDILCTLYLWWHYRLWSTYSMIESASTTTCSTSNTEPLPTFSISNFVRSISGWICLYTSGTFPPQCSWKEAHVIDGHYFSRINYWFFALTDNIHVIVIKLLFIRTSLEHFGSPPSPSLVPPQYTGSWSASMSSRSASAYSFSAPTRHELVLTSHAQAHATSTVPTEHNGYV